MGLIAKLIVIGDGKLRVQIEEQIKELGLFIKILCLGKRSDIPELLQAMDALRKIVIYL